MARAATKTLVLGASGHLGQAILRELLRRGHKVTAATRRLRPPNLVALEVPIVTGDPDAPGQLEHWVSGHEVVIDAAAPYAVNLFSPTSAIEHEPLGYARRRTRALLDAVARHGARLGYISSFVTLPRPEQGLARVATRLRHRTHPYCAVKQLAESMVLAAAQQGLRAVVVNPTSCIGPWDEKPAAVSLIPQLLSGSIALTSDHVVNLIDVRDAAFGLCAALAAELWGQRIPLIGHNMTADQFAARIHALAGRHRPRYRIPAPIGASVLYLLEAGWALLGRPSPMPSLGALLVCESYAMDPSPAARALGLRLRPLAETLRDAVRWYRQRES